MAVQKHCENNKVVDKDDNDDDVDDGDDGDDDDVFLNIQTYRGGPEEGE